MIEKETARIAEVGAVSWAIWAIGRLTVIDHQLGMDIGLIEGADVLQTV